MPQSNPLIRAKRLQQHAGLPALILKDDPYDEQNASITPILLSQYAKAMTDEALVGVRFESLDSKRKIPTPLLFACLQRSHDRQRLQEMLRVLLNQTEKKYEEKRYILTYNISKVQEKLGKVSKQIFYLQKLLRDSPFFPWAVYDLSICLTKEAGRAKEAEAMLERHLQNKTGENPLVQAAYIWLVSQASQSRSGLLRQLNGRKVTLSNYYNIGLHFAVRGDILRASAIFQELAQKMQQLKQENTSAWRSEDRRLLILSKISLLKLKHQLNCQDTQLFASSLLENHVLQLDLLSVQKIRSIISSHQNILQNRDINSAPTNPLCPETDVSGVISHKKLYFDDLYKSLREKNDSKLNFLLSKEKGIDRFFKNLRIKEVRGALLRIEMGKSIRSAKEQLQGSTPSYFQWLSKRPEQLSSLQQSFELKRKSQEVRLSDMKIEQSIRAILLNLSILNSSHPKTTPKKQPGIYLDKTVNQVPQDVSYSGRTVAAFCKIPVGRTGGSKLVGLSKKERGVQPERANLSKQFKSDRNSSRFRIKPICNEAGSVQPALNKPYTIEGDQNTPLRELLQGEGRERRQLSREVRQDGKDERACGTQTLVLAQKTEEGHGHSVLETDGVPFSVSAVQEVCRGTEDCERSSPQEVLESNLGCLRTEKQQKTQARVQASHSAQCPATIFSVFQNVRTPHQQNHQQFQHSSSQKQITDNFSEQPPAAQRETALCQPELHLNQQPIPFEQLDHQTRPEQPEQPQSEGSEGSKSQGLEEVEEPGLQQLDQLRQQRSEQGSQRLEKQRLKQPQQGMLQFAVAKISQQACEGTKAGPSSYDPLASTFNLTGFNQTELRNFGQKPASAFSETFNILEQAFAMKPAPKSEAYSQEFKDKMNDIQALKEANKLEEAYVRLLQLYKQFKGQKEKLEILLNIGGIFQKQGKLVEAEKTYSKCTKFNSAEAFLAVGSLQLNLGKVEEGVENLEKANCLKRFDLSIENRLVYGYSMREETMEKALNLAHNILKKEPNSLETLMITAGILQRQGRVEQAIQIVAAMDQARQAEYIKHYLGILYLQSSNLQQAFSCFKSALSIKPDYVPSLVEAASIISQTHPQQAISILNKTLQLSPGNAKALARLGKIYEAESDFQNAMLTYKVGLESQTNYESYMKIGDCLYKKESYIEALLNYKEALNLRKTHEAYFKVALMFQLKGEYPRAIENYQAALSLMGETPQQAQTRRKHLLTIGKLNVLLGQYEAAITSLEEESIEGQQSAEALQLLGEAYFGNRQYQVALSYLERANALTSGGNLQVLESMAMCLDRMEEYLASKTIYEKILQKNPQNLRCLNNLANILLITGQTNEAFYLFETLLEKAPRNVEKRLKVAEIYAEVGDWSKVEYHLLQCYRQKEHDSRILEKLVLLYKEKRDNKMATKYEKKLALLRANHKNKNT